MYSSWHGNVALTADRAATRIGVSSKPLKQLETPTSAHKIAAHPEGIGNDYSIPVWPGMIDNAVLGFRQLKASDIRQADRDARILKKHAALANQSFHGRTRFAY